LLVANWNSGVKRLYSLSKRFLSLISLALFLVVSGSLVAQTSTETAYSSSAVIQTSGDGAAGQAIQQEPELPRPGQPGSPFQNDHFWNHISLELAGGYSPIVNQGAGYYGSGFTATVGAVYRMNSRLAISADGQILGQHGDPGLSCDALGQNCESTNSGSYIFSFQLSPIVYLLPHATTSPYLTGGVGYYHLGTHNTCQSSDVGCESSSNNPFNSDELSVNAAGFNAGGGVRHRLSVGRQTEIFADVRYHSIASGSSAVGQVSVLPVSVGVRW
jgi:opacity protein-like surface antigen